MQYVANCFGITQNLTPFYHPEGNPVERRNRDLKTQLAILVENDHRTWDENIHTIRFAMNTTKCAAIDSTPVFLNFGRELRHFTDVTHDFRVIIQEDNFVPLITPYLLRIDKHFKDAREINEQEQNRRKEYADTKRQFHPNFEPGSLVLLKTNFLSNAAKGISAKFMPRRDGPYRIRNCGVNTFEVETVEGKFLGTYHSSMLTAFNGTENETPVRELQSRGRPKQTETRVVVPPETNSMLSSTVIANEEVDQSPDAEIPQDTATTFQSTRTRTIKKPIRFS